MFGFFRKHKLTFDICIAIIAMVVSFLYWYDFFEGDKKWKWLGGVVFGVMAIIKVIDLVMTYGKEKNLLTKALNIDLEGQESAAGGRKDK